MKPLCGRSKTRNEWLTNKNNLWQSAPLLCSSVYWAPGWKAFASILVTSWLSNVLDILERNLNSDLLSPSTSYILAMFCLLHCLCSALPLLYFAMCTLPQFSWSTSPPHPFGVFQDHQWHNCWRQAQLYKRVQDVQTTLGMLATVLLSCLLMCCRATLPGIVSGKISPDFSSQNCLLLVLCLEF